MQAALLLQVKKLKWLEALLARQKQQAIVPGK